MTITVRIEFGGDEHPNGETAPVVVSDDARRKARLAFNPSGDERVTRIKALAAALYVELTEIEKATKDALGLDDVDAARQHIQAGAMFAVSAATAHLVK